ncbi:hypothetical protein ANCCAN_25442 [Ancylostoma caninum]|uniref:Uncharacterized protein n=1 Tax=Ancylostoma caninum TaxID=29170 RepID=A0A368F9G7_ANCCA|nr:hypothetical protein ANCCAN_25442 [Ancylostoma caninum]
MEEGWYTDWSGRDGHDHDRLCWYTPDYEHTDIHLFVH